MILRGVGCVLSSELLKQCLQDLNLVSQPLLEKALQPSLLVIGALTSFPTLLRMLCMSRV